jgi:GNAT superfamily N-acetyltransferase
MTSIPRFRGWNVEDSMAINQWKEQNGRIIHLSPNHKKLSSEHVSEIIGKMEMEFGSQEDLAKFHVYLAAYDSKLVAIATVRESVEASNGDVETTVRLGVQRLFVRESFRRKGIASAMLKTIAIMHHKGDLLDIQSDVAFSSPTEDGKKLIRSVLNTDKFFVFN